MSDSAGLRPVPPASRSTPLAGAVPPLGHLVVADAHLPSPGPKPTSLTGQQESGLSVWSHGEAVDAGIWECEPGVFTAERVDVAELCQVVEGTATVQGDDGTRAELRPGSLLVLPFGWRGTWTVHQRLRKLYVLVER